MPAFTAPLGGAVNFELVSFTAPLGGAVNFELDDAPPATLSRINTSIPTSRMTIGTNGSRIIITR